MTLKDELIISTIKYALASFEIENLSVKARTVKDKVLQDLLLEQVETAIRVKGETSKFLLDNIIELQYVKTGLIANNYKIAL